MSRYVTLCHAIFTGACSTLARLGALLAPTIADLDSVAYFLPFVIMGGSSVVVGILAFLLPETRGWFFGSLI